MEGRRMMRKASYTHRKYMKDFELLAKYASDIQYGKKKLP
jgi:hypothetical protein